MPKKTKKTMPMDIITTLTQLAREFAPEHASRIEIGIARAGGTVVDLCLRKRRDGGGITVEYYERPWRDVIE